MNIPGFIDVQVNGFLGINFSDIELNEEDFIRVSKELLGKGTAMFVPTVITSSPEVYRKNLPMMAKVMNMPEFENKLPGFHIEGPFISPEPGFIGAHDFDCVRKPDIGFFDELYDLAEGKIKILTVAAELEGVQELIEHAASKGVTVSLGHQNATEEDFEKAVAAGAVSLTHLSNGMANMIDRHRNTIWAGLANDSLTALVITDGHHVPPTLIKTFIRAKGVDKIVATSDASSLAGCPPGRYHAFGIEAVLEESGYLYNPKRQCMVGSSATMIQCMNFLASLQLLSVEEMLKVGFYNPLRLIGINPESIEADYSIEYDETDLKFKIVKS